MDEPMTEVEAPTSSATVVPSVVPNTLLAAIQTLETTVNDGTAIFKAGTQKIHNYGETAGRIPTSNKNKQLLDTYAELLRRADGTADAFRGAVNNVNTAVQSVYVKESELDQKAASHDKARSELGEQKAKNDADRESEKESLQKAESDANDAKIAADNKREEYERQGKVLVEAQQMYRSQNKAREEELKAVKEEKGCLEIEVSMMKKEIETKQTTINNLTDTTSTDAATNAAREAGRKEGRVVAERDNELRKKAAEDREKQFREEIVASNLQLRSDVNEANKKATSAEETARKAKEDLADLQRIHQQCPENEKRLNSAYEAELDTVKKLAEAEYNKKLADANEQHRKDLETVDKKTAQAIKESAKVHQEAAEKVKKDNDDHLKGLKGEHSSFTSALSTAHHGAMNEVRITVSNLDKNYRDNLNTVVTSHNQQMTTAKDEVVRVTTSLNSTCGTVGNQLRELGGGVSGLINTAQEALNFTKDQVMFLRDHADYMEREKVKAENETIREQIRADIRHELEQEEERPVIVAMDEARTSMLAAQTGMAYMITRGDRVVGQLGGVTTAMTVATNVMGTARATMDTATTEIRTERRGYVSARDRFQTDNTVLGRRNVDLQRQNRELATRNDNLTATNQTLTDENRNLTTNTVALTQQSQRQHSDIEALREERDAWKEKFEECELNGSQMDDPERNMLQQRVQEMEADFMSMSKTAVRYQAQWEKCEEERAATKFAAGSTTSAAPGTTSGAFTGPTAGITAGTIASATAGGVGAQSRSDRETEWEEAVRSDISVQSSRDKSGVQQTGPSQNVPAQRGSSLRRRGGMLPAIMSGEAVTSIPAEAYVAAQNAPSPAPGGQMADTSTVLPEPGVSAQGQGQGAPKHPRETPEKTPGRSHKSRTSRLSSLFRPRDSSPPPGASPSAPSSAQRPGSSGTLSRIGRALTPSGILPGPTTPPQRSSSRQAIARAIFGAFTPDPMRAEQQAAFSQGGLGEVEDRNIRGDILRSPSINALRDAGRSIRRAFSPRSSTPTPDPIRLYPVTGLALRYFSMMVLPRLGAAEHNSIVNDFNRNTNELGFLMDREATGWQEHGQFRVIHPGRCVHAALARQDLLDQDNRHWRCPRCAETGATCWYVELLPDLERLEDDTASIASSKKSSKSKKSATKKYPEPDNYPTINGKRWVLKVRRASPPPEESAPASQLDRASSTATVRRRTRRSKGGEKE